LMEQNLRKLLPLQASTSIKVDIPRFMGTWYILANIPTALEINAVNCVEQYTLDYILYYDNNNPPPVDRNKNLPENNKSYQVDDSRGTISQSFAPTLASMKDFDCGNTEDVITYQIQPTFIYHTINNKKKKTLRTHEFRKAATVSNIPHNTHWKIELKALGLLGKYFQCDYLILDVSDDYSYALIGVPDRSYLWILTRTMPTMYAEFGQTVMSVYDIEYNSWKECMTRDSMAVVSDWMEKAVKNMFLSEEEKLLRPPSTASIISKDMQYHEEKALLGRALRVAHAGGYDVHKILRVPWVAVKDN
jgi:lipocalin